MKNKILLFGLSLFLMMSCSDWTDVESIELTQPDISKQNPELYAQYLQGLRDFKQSEHKITYVYFDNSEKNPSSRVHHIVDLPDSIDVISLSNPVDLADWELKDIATVRNDKGTKVIFTLDFDAIKLDYQKMVEDIENMKLEEGEERPEIPSFISVLVETVNNSLASVNKYNLDGISVAYKGKAVNHMTEDEKKLHITYENAFIKIAQDWQDRNKNKMIVFEGYPQNLLDKSILENCEFIVLPVTDAKDASRLSYNINIAAVEGVPQDKFIIATETTSLDPADLKTGYWADGTRALQNSAEWILAPRSGIDIKGIAIKNVNIDYYNPARAYMYTRNAINTINPSPKK